MDDNTKDAVYERANRLCEYCHLPQAHVITPFNLEHIVAKQHRGKDSLNNLAYACLRCNSHKGPNIAGLDPFTRKLTKLFNPRRHRWERHFRWNGPYLVGRTPVGRVTIAVLTVNGPYLLALRKTLVEEGLFPPA